MNINIKKNINKSIRKLLIAGILCVSNQFVQSSELTNNNQIMRTFKNEINKVVNEINNTITKNIDEENKKHQMIEKFIQFANDEDLNNMIDPKQIEYFSSIKNNEDKLQYLTAVKDNLYDNPINRYHIDQDKLRQIDSNKTNDSNMNNINNKEKLKNNFDINNINDYEIYDDLDIIENKENNIMTNNPNIIYEYPLCAQNISYEQLKQYNFIQPIELNSKEVKQILNKLEPKDRQLVDILLHVIYVIANRFDTGTGMIKVFHYGDALDRIDVDPLIEFYKDSTSYISNNPTNEFITSANISESLSLIYELRQLLNNNKKPYILDPVLDLTDFCNLLKNTFVLLSHDIIYAISNCEGKNVKNDIVILCYKFLEEAFRRLPLDDSFLLNEIGIIKNNQEIAITRIRDKNNIKNIITNENLNDIVKNEINRLKYNIAYSDSSVMKKFDEMTEKIINDFSKTRDEIKKQSLDQNMIYHKLNNLLKNKDYIKKRSNLLITEIIKCHNDGDLRNISYYFLKNRLFEQFEPIWFDSERPQFKYSNAAKLFLKTYDKLAEYLEDEQNKNFGLNKEQYKKEINNNLKVLDALEISSLIK